MKRKCSQKKITCLYFSEMTVRQCQLRNKNGCRPLQPDIKVFLVRFYRKKKPSVRVYKTSQDVIYKYNKSELWPVEATKIT